MIDLRSDTVTKPTAAMRQAMAAAEVGDDVYGEDPTINQLEKRSADILGKEAALFLPTGTMGNTIAIKLHTEHGQEVICESRAHILNYELSMMAWFAGCVARPIYAERGLLTWRQIEPEIRKLGPHAAPTGLIEIENTTNMAGGCVYPVAQIREIAEGARGYGLKVHMDGARVFNAAAALGCDVAQIAAPVDSVMFCLSKGLGAPAGSMLVGTKKDMDRGRLLRKRLGGGMRQAGILGAACLIALEEMPARLTEDHTHARALAAALAGCAGVQVESPVETNIIIADVGKSKLTAAAFSKAMLGRGILFNPISPTKIRMVTHMDVSATDVATVIAAIGEEYFD